MKLAVIGDPVAHSRSPAIHQSLLREAGIAGTYEAIHVAAGEVTGALRRMRGEGYTGCNVTAPLKEEALACCDELLPEARRADAVNTIFFGARTIGTNTDGVGAIAALRCALGGELVGLLIGVLGTGATARAVLGHLIAERARPLLWGRDGAKVAAICARFHVAPWKPGKASVDAADAIFSALSPGARLPADILGTARRSPLVMDANYGERSTLAAQLGRPVTDGSCMLQEQARASFDFWLHL